MIYDMIYDMIGYVFCVIYIFIIIYDKIRLFSCAIHIYLPGRNDAPGRPTELWPIGAERLPSLSARQFACVVYPWNWCHNGKYVVSYYDI